MHILLQQTQLQYIHIFLQYSSAENQAKFN